MKYHFDPSFNLVNKNRYVNLIKYLFEYYDQFVAEVLDNNFEQSVYRDLIYRSARYEYWVYRRHRAYHYQNVRKRDSGYKPKDLISFEEFEQGFTPPVIDAEFSCLRLFIHGLDRVIAHNSIVHDKNGRCFKFSSYWGDLFKTTISSIIEERFPNLYKSRNDSLFNCIAYKARTSVHVPEFIPVYMFVFKLLKKKKLDFKYRTIDREMFSLFMQAIGKISSEREIREILNSDVQSTMDDDDMKRAIYNREQSKKNYEINRILNTMNLPNVVEAYFNVYGNLPANYPVVE